eukprot:4728200-Karenia_brevis.AAC.1
MQVLVMNRPVWQGLHRVGKILSIEGIQARSCHFSNSIKEQCCCKNTHTVFARPRTLKFCKLASTVFAIASKSN